MLASEHVCVGACLCLFFSANLFNPIHAFQTGISRKIRWMTPSSPASHSFPFSLWWPYVSCCVMGRVGEVAMLQRRRALGYVQLAD